MERANKLTWVTGSESNTNEHIVERSADGSRWESIGKRAAQGFSASQQSYELMDHAPLAKAFYRLKSVDFDGSIQLSDVISIERANDGFSIARVFPVPATGAVNVEFNIERKEDVNITVTDLTGRVVHTDSFEATDGVNNYQLDVSAFSAGVYFFSLRDSDHQLTQRIVKQ